MSNSAFQVRRATVDDLDGLRELWRSMGYPADGLERRVTEFQVALADGRVAGMLGLEISGRQGRLYGEAFLDFAHADELRAQFWQRLKLVAANYGVARLWTEETAPFWGREGFAAPDEKAIKKLPAAWTRDERRWFTFQLWDEEAVEKSLAGEVAKFRAEEKAQTDRALRRGRAIKFLATILAIILAIFVGVFTFRMLQAHLITIQH